MTLFIKLNEKNKKTTKILVAFVFMIIKIIFY